MMAVDIKNLCDYSEKIRNVSHILTETLGTTTSYTFLEDTLRPYVKKNLKEYVLDHWNDDELVEIVKSLKKQAELEVKEGWVGAIKIPEGDDGDATKEAVVAYALSQMDGNNLESLKRLIVKDGYSKGFLKGHVFSDVLPAFKKWAEEGKKIYTYSSGVEISHQCLMSNSVDGDITELITGSFESSEFPRTKSESFRELCKKVDSPAEKVAFLTHNAATAFAAHKAGLVVIMLSREGNAYVGHCTKENFPVITSFEDISKQICGKRKKAPDAVESTEGKRAKLDETVPEKESEQEKHEKMEDIKSSSEAGPGEEAPAVADAGEVAAEEKTNTAEEKMEVDEALGDKEREEKKAEQGTEVKIVVTPSVDEGQLTGEKTSEEVNGATEKTEETVEVAKVDEVEVKEVDEEKPETSEKVVDGAEEKKVLENKEESKEAEDKKVVEEGKAEAETEVKVSEDNGGLEVMSDGGKKTEGEKVDETPSTEGEKSKENGISEAKTVENGDAGDGAVSEKEDLEKKEVNGNATHVNGEGDGVAKKAVEPAEKEADKIVAKKVEKDEAKVEVTADEVKESA